MKSGDSLKSKLAFNHCVAVLISLCIPLIGCSRFHTEYGESDGTQGNQSLNGFGAFRTSLEETLAVSEPSGDTQPPPIKSFDLGRLSSRSKRFEAIVWLPTSWPPMNEPAVTDWMETWLSEKKRTLVFVVPDGGSTEAYYRAAAKLAPPTQRLEYRRRLAKQINDRLLEDGQRRDVKVTDWFAAKALPYRVVLSDRRTADYDLVPAARAVIDSIESNETESVEEFELVEMDEDELFAEIDALVEEGDARLEAKAEASNVSQDEEISFERLRQESISFTNQSRKLTTLARLQSPQWNDSQVLVVSSGGLLTNFAMTEGPANELSKRIQSEIRSTVDTQSQEIEIAFLSSDRMPIPISMAKPGVPAVSGMEILTTWPLSLVTMHGLFLGVVMCLMLLPAFGRARRVTYNRTTHFGNHLSAMATLMRSGSRGKAGTDFAKAKISNYMRVVRGETSGPWVLPDESDNGP